MNSINLNYKVILLMVIAIGFCLRIAFIDDGLPFRYVADESHRMDIVMQMLSEKSLNPGWFGHPAQIVIYTLALAIGVFYLFGNLLGVFASSSDFAAWYHNDPTVLFEIGRFIVIVSSVALIIVTAQIARRIFSDRAALLASFILAISPLHVHHSAMIRSSDIVMSLFVMLCVFYSLRILSNKELKITQYSELEWLHIKPYVFSGLFLGFAVTSKYYGVFAACGIVAAHFLNKYTSKKSLLLLLIAMMASLFGAFITGPFLFIDFGTMLNDVVGESRDTHLSATAPGFFDDLVWFLHVLISKGVGIVLFISAVLGAALAYRLRRNESLILLIVPALLIVFLSALSLRWERWSLGLIPFIALFAAFFLDESLKRISVLSVKYYRWGASIAVLLIAFYLPASATLSDISALEKPDTRDIARNWINNNIPLGSSIFVEMRGPQLDKNSYRIVQVGNGTHLRIFDSQSGGFRYVLPRSKYSDIDSVDSLAES